MTQEILILLTGIGLMGAIAQWFAWWVKLPAILFLLLLGLALGPGAGILHPDELFGDLLFPIVSLSVAVILFEGSLTLHFSEIRDLQRVVRNMLTIGTAITWGSISLATYWLMEFSWPLSFLFGALVVVTGPTVIVPMLRTVRPNQKISNILRWEGIVIDPVGALLAVLVFDFIISSQAGHGGDFGHIFTAFGAIVLTGVVAGGIAGHLLGVALRRYLIPEFLHNYVTLTVVFGVFTLANGIMEESGLLAVTVMGIWLANMKRVPLAGILHFKESLSMVLISGLFILLAARLQAEQILQLGTSAIILFIVIQFLVRPLKIAISTLGSGLKWQEKALLAWIAPRGIVAAAVSALFAIRLEEAGVEQAAMMVPLTFMVIIGTVVLQSATAGYLARWLNVAEPEPRGFLIIGANSLARSVAEVLQSQGFRIILTDSHWSYIREARMAGLQTFYGDATSEKADHLLDLVGIGGMLGLSVNDNHNVLAAQRFRSEFGAQKIFTLRQKKVNSKKDSRRHSVSDERRGNPLFSENMTYGELSQLIHRGAKLSVTPLSENYDYTTYLSEAGGLIEPLFAITSKGELKVLGGGDVKPRSNWKIIGLFEDDEEEKVRDKAAEHGVPDMDILKP